MLEFIGTSQVSTGHEIVDWPCATAKIKATVVRAPFITKRLLKLFTQLLI